MTKEEEKAISQFSEGLLDIIDTFITETHDAKVVIAKIESEIERLKQDIGLLNRTIRDGNGQPSVLTRITVLEERIKDIKQNVNSIEGDFEETDKRRWDLLLASIPGFLALVASFII